MGPEDPGYRAAVEDGMSFLRDHASDSDLGLAHPFEGFRLLPDDAVASMRAQEENTSLTRVRVFGTVVGDLSIEGCSTRLTIDCSIEGGLRASGRFEGSVEVWGHVRGDVAFRNAEIVGEFEITGEVDGGVDLDINASEKVGVTYEVGGDLTMSGSVGGELEVMHAVRGNIHLRRLQVAGDVEIQAATAGSVTMNGHFGGGVRVSSRGIGRAVSILGTVEGRVSIDGSITGQLALGGSSVGGLIVSGEVPQLRLAGRFTDRVTLTPKERCLLGSVVGARFEADVDVGDNVSIQECDFRQSAGLDRLNLYGAHLFDSPSAQLSARPDGSEDEIPAREMASVYRQLRRSLEGRSNRPESNRFYRGELDARLRAAWAGGPKSEWLVLFLYRMVSGYGLKAWKPLAWFAATVVLGAFLFDWNGLDLDSDPSAGDRASVGEALVFSTQSMVSLVSAPEAQLGSWGEVLQLLLRFAGPLLLAQAALAIRERVAR